MLSYNTLFINTLAFFGKIHVRMKCPVDFITASTVTLTLKQTLDEVSR